MDERRATNPRKLRNFLLLPGFQLSIGIYNILLAIGFSLLIVLVIRMNFGSMYEVILDLTDVRDEVVETLDKHIKETMFWVIGISSTFTLLNILLSVWYTHRFVGPSVAFRRHIDALRVGNFSIRTVLRKDDAFQDIADRLNDLSDYMEKEKTKTN